MAGQEYKPSRNEEVGLKSGQNQAQNVKTPVLQRQKLGGQPRQFLTNFKD